ncbi:helix-turn-helix domain-containing protein [Candidatus Enterococcus clewellii]|uniref:HTH cro/C1-type domain-containing protein n=1 Tax=Candidatus Enterococcus clewellii TaxID=1834193 RepID=A0A242K1X6_9ENTE|nr:helix-turn-helix transcriptional regulator [Enterococcus sp. 9E7_DIV0242]OTP11658.1 hypothetical protein A5888_003757 [Enterococcus sp. 9E7_DIV0242]
MDTMDIGAHLKTKREEHHLTQEQLANKIFVSRQAISQWENNKTFPDISNLIMLSELYKIPLEQLILKKAIDSTMQKEANQQRQKYARNSTVVLFIVSLTTVIFAIFHKINNNGVVIFYAVLSLLILGIYALYMKKLEAVSEKILYTVVILIVLIFAVATSTSFT